MYTVVVMPINKQVQYISVGVEEGEGRLDTKNKGLSRKNVTNTKNNAATVYMTLMT